MHAQSGLAESLNNWHWLRDLCYALNAEYQFHFEHHIPDKSAVVDPSLELPIITITWYNKNVASGICLIML